MHGRQLGEGLFDARQALGGHPLLRGLGPVQALGTAWFLWRLGRRTIAAGRFPPPGLRLVRDEPVLTGDAATRRGRIAQGLSVIIGLAVVGLALALWRLATLFQNAGA